MNNNNKAILIDAKTNSVTLVEVGEYTDIYKHCGYETFTCVGLGNGETLYVDDEGLINGTDFGFYIEGYEGLLMGNGLILGSTASGDSKSTALSVHEVAEKVRCLRRVGRMIVRSADPANVR
jgi:hypothetical protein